MRPYNLARAQLQGNDVSFPPPTSPALPIHLYSDLLASPPSPHNPVTLPWATGAPGSEVVSYCAADSICQGIRGILVLRKVFNEKVNASLSKKNNNNSGSIKVNQSPGEIILNRMVVRNAILQKAEEGMM